MIPARVGSTVRSLWPLFERAARHEKVDGRLLLAFAWQQSGLDSEATDDTGGRGLFLMGPEVAEKVAKRRAVRSWDLAEPKTAIDFGANQLGRCIERFGLPRLGVAACLTSADAVAAVGGNVPRDAVVQRCVRDVMVTWAWLIRNIHPLLAEGLRTTAAPAPTYTTVAGSGSSVSPPLTTSSGGAGVVLDPPWRLQCGDLDRPRWIDAAMVAEYENTAARLGLVYARDDDERTVYLGMPGLPPLRTSRLIVPVPGAGAASNGAYVGAEALDLLVPVGSPVVAVGSGTIVRTDTPDAVVLQLDTPFVHHGRSYPYASCAGLGRVRYTVEGGIGPHVVQGEVLGWSGVTERMPCVRFALWGDVHGRPFLSPYAIAGYFGWIAEGA